MPWEMLLPMLESAAGAAGSAAVTGGITAGRTARARKQFNKDLMWERNDRQRKIREGARDIKTAAGFKNLAGGVREGTHQFAIDQFSGSLQKQVLEDTRSRIQQKPRGVAGLLEGIFSSFFG